MAEKKGLFGWLGGLAQAKEATPSVSVDKMNDQPYLPKIGKSYIIVGLNYRMDNVMKLAKKNPKYALDKDGILKKGLVDTSIHKYLFINSPAVLEQEPDNPADPKAIKVIVAGQHIGYIKAGSCAHLNKVINEGRVERILCRISGGPVKGLESSTLDEEERKARRRPQYRYYEDDTPIRAELRVVEKEK